MRPWLVFLLLASCAYDPNYGNGDLHCTEGLCPDGFQCVAQRCVAVDPTGPDASRADADPARPDAAAGALGASCENDGDCLGGECADGVCCDSACEGQCESCNAAGACQAVTGKPVGERAVCTGDGTICAGFCDGANRDSCTYQAPLCRAGSCTAGVETKEAFCSDGACPGEVTITCANTSTTPYCGESGCIGPTDIVAGYDATCTLMTDGSVYCWGDSTFGQLGQGNEIDGSGPLYVEGNNPLKVMNVSNAVRLTATSSYGGGVCALLADGTARCWGGNGNGKLGVGSTLFGDGEPKVPLDDDGTPAGSLQSVTQGQYSGCFTTTAGVAKCYGGNSEGTLGTGDTATGNNRIPQLVQPTTSTYASIYQGWDSACAVTAPSGSTTVRCWGSNYAGQIGVTGNAGIIRSATLVGGLGNVDGTQARPVIVGNGTACAIQSFGTLWCWGSNYRGQLGQNTTDSVAHPTPVQVCETAACASLEKLEDAVSVGIGEEHICAVSQGLVRCWGRNLHGQLGTSNNTAYMNAGQGPTFGQGAIAVAVGGYHTCAILSDRSVWCWGWNGDGQLGNGDGAGGDSLLPVRVIYPNSN
jgi:alpha-tubulin suppressor-like RCC1 family protein